MEFKGVVDARQDHGAAGVSPADRLAGVPLVLWAAHKLAVGLGGADRVGVIDPSGRCAPALARHSFRTIDAHDVDTWRGVIADWSMPFLSPQRFVEAQRTGQPASLHGIESIRVTDAPSLELAEAVARGLGSDDPRIAGVRRFALPTDRNFLAVVSDVDGCLTDGTVMRTETGDAMRSFNTKDGIGHRKLQAAGILVGWLSTAMECRSIQDRARSLGVDAVDAGSGHKGPRFETLCARMGVDPSQVVFLGDDIHDLPAMRMAGAMACPRDAHPEVRAVADLVLNVDGGRGAFRELADILAADVTEDRLKL